MARKKPGFSGPFNGKKHPWIVHCQRQESVDTLSAPKLTGA
jgi:hypothetical protein